MRIIALDVFESKLSELTNCLRTVFPDAEIVPFADPFFAVKYGLDHKVDMLFTEILMRCLGGLTVAELIRKNNKAALIYFVADTDKYREEAKEANYSGFLVRPITEDAIREITSI